MNFLSPQPSHFSPRAPMVISVLLMLLAGVSLIGISYVMPRANSLLRTQVAGGNGERIVTGSIATSKLSPGSHRLQLDAQTVRGDTMDNEVAFTVLQATPTPTPIPTSPPSSGGGGSGGGGGGGSGGGGGGGGGGDAPQPQPVKPKYIFPFQPEKGHAIKGVHSGIFTDGKRKIVRLANGKGSLEKAIKVPLTNYWLEMTVKDDRPGPVKVGIDLNGKRWKTVTLNKNDNKYRTVRVGMLRRFKSGTIRFTLLNDTFDRKNPARPSTDRNFEIDSWRLVSEK